MIVTRRFLAASFVLFLILFDGGMGCGSALRAESPSPAGHKSVDTIDGLGKYKLGAKFSDFPPGSLLPIDAKAKAGLLQVSPYGDNYLVSDLAGLTWANIPLAGLVLTFHDGILIDLQMALKARNIDLYIAKRAFREKYGDSYPAVSPVDAWGGRRIQVTMIFTGAIPSNTSTLNDSSSGLVEIFDQARWNKMDAVEKTKLKNALDQQYETAGAKVKANL